MKACNCAICGTILPTDTTEAEAAEAKHYFGREVAFEEGFAQVCPKCFAAISVCPNCGWRGLAPIDVCPRCASKDLRRGHRCLQYDKDQGVIGDGQVDFDRG